MGVNLKQNGDSSLGLQGTDADDGAFIYVDFQYSPTSLNQSTRIFDRRMIVKSIRCVPDVVATNAVTATVVRAASGTAISAGTLLHSGTFNAQAAAGTNVTLALVATPATLDIPAGTRLGVNFSGALGAAGNGVITVVLAPA